MLLFADHWFWKPPSVVDVFGWALGIFSLWYAWQIAKRDLTKQIEDSRKRFALNLVANVISDAMRYHGVLIQSINGKDWSTAIIRLSDIEYAIDRIETVDGMDGEWKIRAKTIITDSQALKQHLQIVSHDESLRRKKMPPKHLHEADSIGATIRQLELKVQKMLTGVSS